MSVSRIVNDLYNGLSYESLDEWFNNLKHYEPPEIDLNDKSNIKYTTPLEIDWNDTSLGRKQ